MTEWLRIARVSDIALGAVKTFPFGDTQVAIFNLGGEFLALEDICTHDGGFLANGQVKGDQVICPRHGAHFDIRTGAPLCAPATEPVPKFAVQVAEGWILLRR